eukprot:Gb_00241 [translate_table: standard]
MYKEKACVEEVAPLKHAWTIDGCSIVMDGWTDVHNRPLLNIIVSTSGPYFFRAIDYLGQEKNIIAQGIKCCSITNVAPVCKVPGLFVQNKYNIFWTPCVHALNNALKDIGKFDWIAALIEKGREIQMFICNHHQSHAMYRKFA